jgi:hypothetical protein
MKVKNGFQVWVDRAIQPEKVQASGSWWIGVDRKTLQVKAHEELQRMKQSKFGAGTQEP